MPKADLRFAPTHQPRGFTGAELAKFDGSPEPVVRELLQNCLDAAQHAGRPAKVLFLITEVDLQDVPGIERYSEVFERAVEERQRYNAGEPSQDELMVRKRIQRSLKGPKLPMLVCIDNGHGLNGHRMDSLLTPGNTSKGGAGAGSFGLGHYAPFAASDLRYVLYGARYKLEKRQPDNLGKIVSGHAILASWRDENQRIMAADGYWSVDECTLFDHGDKSYYSTTFPPLLARYMQDVDETGTTVCVTGFNEFHRDDNDPLPDDEICRVAAANFSSAIHKGEMEVNVRDDRRNIKKAVTRDTLGAFLRPIAGERRAPSRGQIRGELAYSAWRALSEGAQYRDGRRSRHSFAKATAKRAHHSVDPHFSSGHVDHLRCLFSAGSRFRQIPSF